MKKLGRIGLFLLTNVAVIVTISIILNILGVGHYITETGLDYKALAIFCLCWGMIGSFISLAISRMMAKWSMGVKLVDPESPGQFKWYLETTHRLARKAEIKVMPQVGYYESPEINGFATGPTKNRALVALSTGLMQKMNENEIEGVIAHEIAHIQNGDMVTMTLLQGVINAFVMFFARVIAFAASQKVKEEQAWMVRFAVTIVLEIVFGMLGVMITSWFSRKREFRADKGSAALAGREKMIAALEALQRNAGIQAPNEAGSFATMKISGKKSKFLSLFSTHPPLEKRLRALQTGR